MPRASATARSPASAGSRAELRATTDAVVYVVLAISAEGEEGHRMRGRVPGLED
jgi:hypothetical protein